MATNHEVADCLQDMVRNWFLTQDGNYMEAFAEALLRRDLKEMNKQIKEIVQICASSFDSGVHPSRGRIHPENYFHGLVTGLITCLLDRYIPSSNKESGTGRYDLTLIPRDRQKEHSGRLRTNNTILH